MTKEIKLERENKQLKEQQQESIRLLKLCDKAVGMDLGEIINAHIAAMEGKRFNPIDYHYEAMPTEQRI